MEHVLSAPKLAFLETQILRARLVEKTSIVARTDAICCVLLGLLFGASDGSANAAGGLPFGSPGAPVSLGVFPMGKPGLRAWHVPNLGLLPEFFIVAYDLASMLSCCDL